ncbi:MAG TPA: orotate phosphoribosyltransferase [Acidimicrobiales bacterium]|nr:orotate phosphoribosyltransferase [Acidimicrobiales bacterium]
MDREELGRRIYSACYLTGQFRLRSGQVSSAYFDKYRLEADPVLLREVGGALASQLPAGTEVVAGLELGGVPLATVVSQLTGLPAAFVRKAAKPYGTCQLAEGAPVEGRRVAVVEDVVTTGGQVVASCLELAAAGARVRSVLCVVDREAGASASLAAHGVALSSLFTLAELGALAGQPRP